MTPEERTTWRLRLGLPAGLPGRHGPPKGDLSAHRIRLLDRCPAAYAFEKVDGLGSKFNGAKLRGAVVHAALESAARHALASDKPADKLALRNGLEKACATFKAPTAVYGEAWRLMEKVNPKLLDFSRTVSVEENWCLRVDLDARGGPEFKAVGAFDRIDVTEDGVVEIHDYKSGADVRSVAELRDDPQPLLYAAFITTHWQGPVRVVFHYLAADVSVRFDCEDGYGQRGISLARAKMAEIRAAETWPARTGPHCVTCDFKGLCPSYSQLLKTEASLSTALGTDEDLLVERQRCSMLAKVFEDHRKVCDRTLRDRIEAGGTVIGGGLRAKMVTRVSRSLPDNPVAICEAINEATGGTAAPFAQDITSVNEAKLSRWLERLDADLRRTVEARLVELRQERDLASYVDVRPIAGGF